jgi:signal transduction histidine kinase
VDGIKAGISGAWSGFLSWLGGLLGDGLVGWAKRKLGIGSPSRVFANEVGAPIAQGIQAGFERESSKIRNSIAGAVNDAILDARSNLSSLTSNLAGMAAERIRASTRAAFGADPTAASAAYEQERAARERLMVDRQRMELQEGVKAARTRADRVRAEQALADFEAEQNLARLEQAARDEEAEISRRDSAAQAAGERAQQDINNLVARFNQGAISADQFRTELNALIGGPAGDELGAAFALNFNTALNDVTTQLAEFAREVSNVFGLAPGTVVSPANIRAALLQQAAEAEAAEAKDAPAAAGKDRKLGPWGTIAQRDAAFAKLAAATKKRAVKTKVGNKFGITVKALADGGIIQRAILAGEAGPEAVIPLTGSAGRNALARAMEDAGAQAGGGGTVINLTVHGVMAGDVREFAQRLKPELARVLTAGY